MKKYIIILTALLLALPAAAQKDFGGIARFDRTVFDFGKVKHLFCGGDLGKQASGTGV